MDYPCPIDNRRRHGVIRMGLGDNLWHPDTVRPNAERTEHVHGYLWMCVFYAFVYIMG